MVNITKIRNLASEKGIKLSYLCSLCGRQRGWIKDIELKGSDISEDKLQIIAAALGTSTEYLRDKKELAKNPAYQELTPEQIQLLEAYASLSDTQKTALIAFLSSLKD